MDYERKAYLQRSTGSARDLRKWFYTLQFTLNNNLLKDIAEMKIARLGYGD